MRKRAHGSPNRSYASLTFGSAKGRSANPFAIVTSEFNRYLTRLCPERDNPDCHLLVTCFALAKFATKLRTSKSVRQEKTDLAERVARGYPESDSSMKSPADKSYNRFSHESLRLCLAQEKRSRPSRQNHSRRVEEDGLSRHRRPAPGQVF